MGENSEEWESELRIREVTSVDQSLDFRHLREREWRDQSPLLSVFDHDQFVARNVQHHLIHETSDQQHAAAIF